MIPSKVLGFLKHVNCTERIDLCVDNSLGVEVSQLDYYLVVIRLEEVLEPSACIIWLSVPLNLQGGIASI